MTGPLALHLLQSQHQRRKLASRGIPRLKSVHRVWIFVVVGASGGLGHARQGPGPGAPPAATLAHPEVAGPAAATAVVVIAQAAAGVAAAATVVALGVTPAATAAEAVAEAARAAGVAALVCMNEAAAASPEVFRLAATAEATATAVARAVRAMLAAGAAVLDTAAAVPSRTDGPLVSSQEAGLLIAVLGAATAEAAALRAGALAGAAAAARVILGLAPVAAGANQCASYAAPPGEQIAALRCAGVPRPPTRCCLMHPPLPSNAANLLPAPRARSMARPCTAED